jgi:Leucine-rich repeat (LRR) protein
MGLRPALIKAALFGFAVYSTHCKIVTAQTPNPSRITTLTIREENASLLKKLKEYQNLEVLSITCVESLQALPDDIGQLKKLRELSMNNGNGCAMNPKLPESIGSLHALEKLDLYGAQDPRPVGKHYGPQPTQRQEFPESMSQLQALTYLDLGRNGLEEIPAFVKNLIHLKELGFGWNMKVRNLPRFLGSLPELQTLRLDADGLTDIPDFLRGPKLSLITLGYNCIITTSAPKKKALEQRFRGVKLDFEDEYDCPDKK